MTEKPQDRLAFDLASVRRIDADGHMHIETANISKACVSGYYGREIPNAAALGLMPDALYQLYRDPEELAKGAATFEGKPLLLVHKAQSAEDHSRELTVGAVSGVSFDHPFLKAALAVWDGEGIAGIESKTQQQLSSSYRYVADMTPGVSPDGKPYDGSMRGIVGNHVALVEKGRAGPDCIVGDSEPIHTIPEFRPMKTATRKDAFAALAAAHTEQANLLRPKMANDAAITATVKALEKMAADAMKAKDESEEDDDDMDMTKDKKAKDERPDDQKDGESDEDYADRKKREAAADKRAKDEADADKLKKEGQAMDAAISAAVNKARADVISEMYAIREAERVVRPHVGEIVVAMDSAAAVYKFALDKAGVDTAGVPPAAFKAMVGMLPVGGPVPSPRVAMDSARTAQTDFNKRFPEATKLVRG